jgi:Holliday junction resolvase RusA-like endonuclease
MTATRSDLAFDVPGRPVPQGSKGAYFNRRTGRTNIVETTRGLRAWRDVVTATAMHHAKQAGWRTPDRHVGLFVVLGFVLPSPVRMRGDGATTRPDLDKLTRAVFDAMTDAHIWHDDAQVTACIATKRYAAGDKPIGVRILISPASDLVGELSTMGTGTTDA